MKRADTFESAAFSALRKAVAEALERKRLLGQYAIIWRDGKVDRVIPDPPARVYPSSAQHGARIVAEPGD
jgi:hypothetical protein